MRLFKTSGILAAAWLIATASTARAETVVDSWVLVTRARDTVAPFVTVENVTVTLPLSDVDTATDASTEAESSYDFTAGADFASFDFLFDHVRSANEGSLTESTGAINFSLTEPLYYTLAGSFTLAGTRRIYMRVSLLDESQPTDPEIVYRGYHESNATPDAALTLGLPGGDVGSEETGELCGTLVPGTPYRLSYLYLIENYPFDPDSDATAEGMLSFTLAPLPEPSSLTLLALGTIAVLRRRRHARA